MRAQPVDLIGGFYTSDSLPWSCQDTVNWLPVMAEVAGTRTVSMFATPPGLKPYQQIGTGPIRGMHDCEGLRLIVSGRYLFRISNTGVGVPLGIIPGVGRVQMTHNQFKTGYQVLVENGQGGGGYVYNTVDDTFAKITDEGYPGSISSDYLDSYLLGVEPLGRFWFHSNLADATDYNTLDRYEAEAAPDKIVGLAVSQFEVVVFGQRTIEFFFNAGGQTGTFQNRRQSITRGCASRHTIQKLDNTLFWLGDDGVVYRMEGYAARPVSTRALEKAISGYNWAEAIAFTWEDRGHKVYYLTFPDGQTFGYDVVSGLWHRRESFGINRWRLSHTQKWGRDWYGGDFQNGRIWQLDWDYYLEGNDPIVSERTTGVTADNQSALLLPNAELIFDTGHGPGTQPDLPKITGDIPNGYVGMSGTGSYVRSGGDEPYGDVHISSGSLPPGCVVAGDGAYSYNFTQVGSFAWEASFKDSRNRVGLTQDSSVVTDDVAWMARASGAGNGTMINARYLNGGFSGSALSPIAGNQTFLNRSSGLLHLSGDFNPFYAYSDDNGATWKQPGNNSGVSTGSGRVAFLDGYVFVCGGISQLRRRILPGGDWEIPSASNLSRANSILVLGNEILVASIYATTCNVSTDKGVTWQARGSFQSGISASPVLASNGSRVCVLYTTSSNQTVVKYSDNSGLSWSAASFTFSNQTASNQSSELIFDGLYWIAFTTLGQIARSTDGENWVEVSGQNVKAMQVAIGPGMLTAACGTDGVRYSTNHGLTWSSRGVPGGASSTTSMLWVGNL
ncbi:hypothetical protein [Stenotrophomonas geniculata]|uniref:hypothetical protein n=1 Tax=Stenotrophomonas geniculata TaxID=86188 RepID=UPI002E784E53|nr:hypothetical protein [Stenotrophomonas geniculata]